MNKSLYVIGSEPLHEWERRNNYPSCIVLTGNVSANTFSDFAHDFDYTKYKQISFDELFVEDILYKDGKTCTYEEYLSQFVCGDAIRLFVLIKLYLISRLQSLLLFIGIVYILPIIKHLYMLQKQQNL